MKIKLITFICLFLTGNILLAQHAKFTSSGSIEYEKSANSFALIKKMLGKNIQSLDQQLFDQYQKSQKQFIVLKSTLRFNSDKMLFTPTVPESSTQRNFFGTIPMSEQNSTIYTDLATNTSVSQKNVFDDFILVKDTVRKIKWKITDETREIAGYTCRRANGLVMDSIYAVAFYTDKIPLSGGPESFCGLPGMILEIALPHENISWKATKVNEVAVSSAAIVPPKKGKAMNSKQFYEMLKSSFKNRGDAAQIDLIIKSYLL
jgi:GLPGLI family protein